MHISLAGDNYVNLDTEWLINFVTKDLAILHNIVLVKVDSNGDSSMLWSPAI